MIYFEVSQKNKFSQTIGSLPACDPISHAELERVRPHSGTLYKNWRTAKIGAERACSYFRDYYKIPYNFYVCFYDEDGTFLTSDEL